MKRKISKSLEWLLHKVGTQNKYLLYMFPEGKIFREGDIIQSVGEEKDYDYNIIVVSQGTNVVMRPLNVLGEWIVKIKSNLY